MTKRRRKMKMKTTFKEALSVSTYFEQTLVAMILEGWANPSEA
jgi:hypothetical protein